MLLLLACAWPMEVDNSSGAELVGVRVYRSGTPACDDRLEAPIVPGATGVVDVPVPRNAYADVEWTWADGRCVLMPYFTLADAYTLREEDRDLPGACACE